MMKEIVYTSKAPKPVGPYNQAVLTGGTLYISGQIPIKPETGELVANDIKAETRQVLNNINEILKEAGMNFKNLVKTTIYLTKLDIFISVNEEYEKVFSGNYPAREIACVAGLPLNANIEISGIAVK